MKHKKLLFVSLSLSTLILPIAGCGKKGNEPVDDKTIVVKVYKGGYGTTWLYQLKEKFEKLYSKEGYKVSIKSPDATLKANDAIADMRLPYSKSNTDLYFVQDVSSSDVTNVGYGVVAETLDDVYNSSPISYDGTEENGLIKDKLKATYSTSVMKGDNYYSTLWASSPCGLVVNKAVLEKYSLDLPYTSDQLKACYDEILTHSKTDDVYPIAWGGQNSYGYSLFCLYPQLASVLGKKVYQQFLSLQDDPTASEPTQNDIDNNYSFYNKENIYTAVRLLRQFYDKAYSYPGSITATHGDAHTAVILGEAAFTFDGEFFFNEVKTLYKDYLDDVTFMNTPLNSQLGVNLGITDAKLAEVAKYVDEGKTVSEIVELSSLNQPTVEKIYEARNAYYEKANHNAYIRKGSPKAEIAKLFLRMSCSDDFAATFNQTANASYPYASTNSVTSQYEFVNNVAKLINRKDAWGVSNLNSTGLRLKASINLYHPYNAEMVKTLVADDDAETVISRIKDYMTNVTNWNTLMRNAGYEPSK